MRVVDGFQTSQMLQKLPADFRVIQVKLESLKDNTLRRLCRDIETQHELEQASLSDRVSYEERLVQILTDGLWETTDLDKTLLVLGNKSGVMTGRFFNQADIEKLTVDHRQFGDKYPIFLDTSTVKELEGHLQLLNVNESKRSQKHLQRSARERKHFLTCNLRGRYRKRILDGKSRILRKSIMTPWNATSNLLRKHLETNKHWKTKLLNSKIK